MKNKYQEALDIIKETLLHEHLFDEDKWNEVNDVMKPYFSTIQKLIDKETPMKPIEGKGFTVHDCPTCDDGYIEVDGYYKLNRCVNCGQKIDWSDEE